MTAVFGRGGRIMAIYHLSAKVISRGKGQSAIASAAYRSGEKLHDERTGETKFYNRDVQPDTLILAPSHSPEWVTDRERLWNEVEKAEKRVNSQLAREFEISLPRELSHAQQKELIKSYAQEQFVNQGMVADIAIHRDDKNNPHAHVMLTTREISPDGFTNKNRDWNNRKQLENWREQWSLYANKTMEREGVNERIDHRSFKDQGKEELPTQHLGHQAHAMEQKGIRTERGDYNREVQAYNKELRQNIFDLQKYRQEKQQIERNIQTKKYLKDNELADIKQATKIVKGYVTLDSIKERREQLNNWTKGLDNKRDGLNRRHDQFKKAQTYVEKLHDIEQKKARAENDIKSVKDIKGVWEQNKVEGIKKALDRTFNRKEGNQLIEKAQKDIQFLEEHEQNFNKYLEPYRNKFNFHSREEFYSQQIKFESEKAETLNDLRGKHATIKEEHQTLNKAEKALQQKVVREVTSHYPELRHLGDTMKYKDALALKTINDTMGQTVPISNISKAIELRTNTIHNAQHRLQEISNSEKLIERTESNFDKLDQVQSKIDLYDNSLVFQTKKLFSKSTQQDYEKFTIQRDQLQTAINKDGFTTRDELSKYKKAVERIAQQERPQLEKAIKEAKQGKTYEGRENISIDQLKEAVNGVERAERDYQREQKRETEKELSRDYERDIGG